jgi:hypothetical protein
LFGSKLLLLITKQRNITCCLLIPILDEDAPKLNRCALKVSVMTRAWKVEISESQQELEKALKYATTASSKER